MSDGAREHLRRFEMEALDRLTPRPAPQPEPQTIAYTDLPADTSMSPLAAEWNFYRREAGRLLAEGHEGKWVLIKGEKVVGTWDTEEAAYEKARTDYFMQPVLIHRVLTGEPVLRGPTFLRLWRN